MSESGSYSARQELLAILMEKANEDVYPSATMLDMIEGLLTPDDVPAYAESLMSRVRSDRFPSISMMRRAQRFA